MTITGDEERFIVERITKNRLYVGGISIKPQPQRTNFQVNWRSKAIAEVPVMKTSLITAAASIALAGALFHGVVGGKIYMGHIKAIELMPLTQSLSLVAWQMFTVFLVVSGATLLCVAMKPNFALLACPVLVGNALGTALFSL